LIKLMDDDKANVRYGAAISLSMIGDQRAVDVLQKATEDENSVVRKVAIVALKEVKNRL